MLSARPGVGVVLVLVWLIMYAASRQRPKRSGTRSARDIYNDIE